VKTRRSPRNQMILWRALTSPVDAPKQTASVPRCWDCVSYPKGGRARGECSLVGQIVNGRSKDRPCFTLRGAV
jgi:hypothetical protein